MLVTLFIDCRIIQQNGNYSDVSLFCETLFNEPIRSPYLLAFMIDGLEDQLESKSGDSQLFLERALEVELSSYYYIFIIIIVDIYCLLSQKIVGCYICRKYAFETSVHVIVNVWSQTI